MFAETKVQAQVVLRNVASSAPHFVHLDQIPGKDMDTRVQRQPVAPGPRKLKADPMVARELKAQYEGVPILLLSDVWDMPLLR